MPNYYADFHKAVCPECGKEFVLMPRTVYKERVNKKRVPFCSWNCLCEYRRKQAAIANGDLIINEVSS